MAIRPLREPGRGHWLLVRRRLKDGELAFYVCYGPARTTLAELVRVAGTRWTMECSFQQAKGQTGLDHYQVRRYDAWYRHITLAMLANANAFLAVMRATALKEMAAADTGAAERAEVAELLPLTVPEIRRCWPPWCGGWRTIPPSCWPGQAGGAVTRRVLVVATGNDANDSEKCGCSIRS